MVEIIPRAKIFTNNSNKRGKNDWLLYSEKIVKHGILEQLAKGIY